MGTVLDDLQVYARASQNLALGERRKIEALERERSRLDEIFAVPDALAGDDRVTPANSMKASEERRIRDEIAACGLSEKIYKRRAEYAGRGFLYFGRAEMVPRGSRYSVEPVPPDLNAACVLAGLVVPGEDDLSFD